MLILIISYIYGASEYFFSDNTPPITIQDYSTYSQYVPTISVFIFLPPSICSSHPFVVPPFVVFPPCTPHLLVPPPLFLFLRLTALISVINILAVEITCPFPSSTAILSNFPQQAVANSAPTLPKTKYLITSSKQRKT